jgi:hypothetical protein
MKTTRTLTKKDKKERKDKGKEKIRDKKTEQEQCFIKLWETWKKNAGNRGHPPLILTVALKRAQKSDWGKIYDIFSPCVFIFSPLDHAIIVLLSETV